MTIMAISLGKLIIQGIYKNGNIMVNFFIQ